jgi:hypothetical protein
LLLLFAAQADDAINGRRHAVRIDSAEVEQHPQRIGGRDAVADDGSKVGEVTGVVEFDTVETGLHRSAGKHHVDRIALWPPDAPQVGARAV